MPKQSRVGDCSDISSPTHSSLRLSPCLLFPHGYHFSFCLQLIFQTLFLFSSLPSDSVVGGYRPHILQGSFWHCCELNDLPPCYRNCPSSAAPECALSASLTFSFTLRVHTGERKLRSDGAFRFPEEQDTSERDLSNWCTVFSLTDLALAEQMSCFQCP